MTVISLVRGCDFAHSVKQFSSFGWRIGLSNHYPCTVLYTRFLSLSFQHSWAHRVRNDQKQHSINTKAVDDHKYCIGLFLPGVERAARENDYVDTSTRHLYQHAITALYLITFGCQT